jgi:peptide deformylase
MAVREIVFLPEPILRSKAHKVTSFDKDFQKLVDDMIDTLHDAPGVGLAAPQINESLRLIVVEYGDEENEEAPSKLYVLANPEITQRSEEKVMGIEACLSVPELAGEVERSKRIIVKGSNRRGLPVKYKLSGWKARIFQHEIDHLDGIVFTDIAAKVWKPGPEDEGLIKD